LALDHSISVQDAWLQTPMGRYLCQQEQALFEQAVSDVFGFYAVQYGLLQMPLLERVRMPHRFQLDETTGHAHCESVMLPLPAASVDLLLMPHTLDWSPYPQQTLREVERVLVPEGHLMLTGFNPISTWGGLQRLNRDTFPWNSQFLSLTRVKDWLALLGLEVIETRMCCFSMPIASEGWRERLRLLETATSKCLPMMGGVYFVIARKKVLGMRLIRPNWKRSRMKPRLATAPSQKDEYTKK
jgi:SAM-dependent methyltransferase